MKSMNVYSRARIILVCAVLLTVISFAYALTVVGEGSFKAVSRTGEVQTIVVEPSSATLVVRDTLDFNATGFDENSTIVSITPVWSVICDSTVGIIDNSTGVFTAGSKAGTCSILATAGGISNDPPSTVTVKAGTASNMTVSANPTSISADGASQSTVTAKVTDTYGNGVANHTVAFNITRGSGNLSSSSGVTNSSGHTTTKYTSSTSSGVITVTAVDNTVGIVNGSVNISLTGSGSNPTINSASSNSAPASPKNVGQNVTFTVNWSDADSNPSKILVCKTDSVSGTDCVSGQKLCGTTNTSTTNPQNCTYTAQDSDESENTWYAFACDSTSKCSTGKSVNCSVNHAPALATTPSITGAPFLPNTTLTCGHGEFSDQDEDSNGSSNWQWIRNGVTIVNHTTQVYNSTQNRGDNISCREQPVDEHDLAGSYYPSNTVTITNDTTVYGYLQVSLVTPQEEVNYNDSDVFNFTVQVSCVGGVCGNATATLDPQGSGDGSRACTTPTDDMVFNSNTTFCTGTYNLPSGVSIIANGVTLDCNNSLLVGNQSMNGFDPVQAISALIVSGATIMNCNITNYTRGMVLAGSSNSVVDNEIYGLVSGGAAGEGVLIAENGTVIRGNFVHDVQGGGIVIAGPPGSTYSDLVVSGNTISNAGGNGLGARGVVSSLIANNTVSGSTYNGITLLTTINSNVTGNSLTGNAFGLFLQDSHNILVWHNNIYSNYGGISDDYQVVSENSTHAPIPIELSLDGAGNYWGHTYCSYFNAGNDSNDASVEDNHPYNQSYAPGEWPEDPPECDSGPTTTTTTTLPGCVNATDDMNIDSDTTFCTGVYNLPNGINIADSGITLDCNNSLLIGNFSIEYDEFAERNNSVYTVNFGPGSDGVTVMNCKITNYTGGIFVSTDNLVIYNNEIYNIQSVEEADVQGYGLWISGTGVNISNNVIHDTPEAMFIANTHNSSFTGNNIYNNTLGITVRDGSTNNVFADNSVCDNDYDDFNCMDTSNTTDGGGNSCGDPDGCAVSCSACGGGPTTTTTSTTTTTVPQYLGYLSDSFDGTSINTSRYTEINFGGGLEVHQNDLIIFNGTSEGEAGHSVSLMSNDMVNLSQQVNVSVLLNFSNTSETIPEGNWIGFSIDLTNETGSRSGSCYIDLQSVGSYGLRANTQNNQGNAVYLSSGYGTLSLVYVPEGNVSCYWNGNLSSETTAESFPETHLQLYGENNGENKTMHITFDDLDYKTGAGPLATTTTTTTSSTTTTTILGGSCTGSGLQCANITYQSLCEGFSLSGCNWTGSNCTGTMSTGGCDDIDNSYACENFTSDVCSWIGGGGEENESEVQVVLNEVELNPASGSTWVELYNQNTSVGYNLTAYEFSIQVSNGSIYDFPTNALIGAGGYYVFEVALNSTDNVTLVSGSGENQFEVDWTEILTDNLGDDYCWAVVPDGEGRSGTWTFQNCTRNATNNLPVDLGLNPQPNVTSNEASVTVASWGQYKQSYYVWVPSMQFNNTAKSPYIATSGFLDPMYYDVPMFEDPDYTESLGYQLLVNVSANSTGYKEVTLTPQSSQLYPETLLMMAYVYTEESNFMGEPVNHTLLMPAEYGIGYTYNGIQCDYSRYDVDQGAIYYTYNGTPTPWCYPGNLTFNQSTSELTIPVYINDTGVDYQLSIIYTLGLQMPEERMYSPVYLLSQNLTGGFIPEEGGSPPAPGTSSELDYTLEINNSLNFYSADNVFVRFNQPLSVTIWNDVHGGTVNLSSDLTTDINFQRWNYSSSSWYTLYNWSYNSTEDSYSYSEGCANVTEKFPGSPMQGQNITLCYILFDFNLSTVNGWAPGEADSKAKLRMIGTFGFDVLSETVPAGAVGENNYSASISTGTSGMIMFNDSSLHGFDNRTNGSVVVILDGRETENYQEGSVKLYVGQAGVHSVNIRYTIDETPSTTTTTTVTTTSSTTVSTTSTTSTTLVKEIVPEGSGAPFYTSSNNPVNWSGVSCLRNMTNGSACNVTWVVYVNVSSGIYEFYAIVNTSQAGNESGKVNVTIGSEAPATTTTSTTVTTTTSVTTTSTTSTSTTSTTVPLMEQYNVTINVTANQTYSLNASGTGVVLDITPTVNLTGVSVTVTVNSSNPTNASFGLSGLNKYVGVNVSSELESNLSSVVIRISYTDSEVSAQNLTESALSMYWLNETITEWQRLNSSTPWMMPWVYGSGVDTTNNFVWANVTHFSYYTIGGETLAASSDIILESGWNLISLPVQ